MESTKEEAMQLFGTFLDLVELHRSRIHNMIMDDKASEGLADEVHATALNAGAYLVKALPTDAVTLPVMEIITDALAKSYTVAMTFASRKEDDT